MRVQKVLCYGPHPGLAGAVAPIPALAKAVAEEYDGMVVDVNEVVARLEAACPDGQVTIYSPAERDGMICLERREGDTRHKWRVLRIAISFDPICGLLKSNL